MHRWSLNRVSMYVYQSKKCLVSILVFGVLNLVIGIITLFSYSSILEKAFVHRLALTPDSFSHSLWSETPIPMHIKFYFFNWTNPGEFILNHSKPRFEEIGPYTYSEHHVKVNVTWTSENASVTYMQKRVWVFVPELSNGTEDDVVRTLNVPLVSASSMVKDWGKVVIHMFNLAVKQLGEKIFLDSTVGELLFEGLETPLMKIANEFAPMIPVPYDKFGWFYMRNNSPYFDGVFNMDTGVDDIMKIGRLNTWNYTQHNGFYPSHCGLVNGSAGEFFPPLQTRTSISLYVPDICRSITLNYRQEMSLEGILGYSYVADDTLFMNPPDNCPENWCFCLKRGCQSSGVLDVSSCRYDSPSYVSYPHFLYANPIYTNNVDGLSPDKSKHLTHIDLEPQTGVPLSVFARFQINLILEKVRGLDLFANISEIMIPVIWFETNANLDSTLTSPLRMFIAAPMILTIVGSIFAIVGIILIIFGIVELLKAKNLDSLVPHSSLAT